MFDLMYITRFYLIESMHPCTCSEGLSARIEEAIVLPSLESNVKTQKCEYFGDFLSKGMAAFLMTPNVTNEKLQAVAEFCVRLGLTSPSEKTNRYITAMIVVLSQDVFAKEICHRVLEIDCVVVFQM